MSMFVENFSIPVSSLATNKLYEVWEDDEQLSEKNRELLHLELSKCLFIMKMSRPDLDTAMSFLRNIVSNIDVDDWINLRSIPRFFQCTLKDRRSFSVTNIDKIFTWLNASYMVHHDVKS